MIKHGWKLLLSQGHCATITFISVYSFIILPSRPSRIVFSYATPTEAVGEHCSHGIYSETKAGFPSEMKHHHSRVYLVVLTGNAAHYS